MTEATILVIEDDKPPAEALREGLGHEGFDCRLAHSGEEGFFLFGQGGIDLVVLDWMLPARDGIEVLQTLRQQWPGVPVIMLTARDEVRDRVTGLDAGADDYLTKPFAFAELLARIRSLLRRRAADGPAAQGHLLASGDLEIDLLQRRVTRDGLEISLTPREFDLIAQLAQADGAPVSRDTLAREVWRETHRATPLDNVIDVHVTRLRKKLEENGGPRLIHTVRGLGFVLRPQGS